MKCYVPKYYTQFRCIAAACPDSCCKDWEVDIDEATAKYYSALPGALGEELRSVLRTTEDGTCMTIRDGRCPMWRADGLCKIQAQLGHDGLSKICREFPRLCHDYGSFQELGLEMSCPEAARLIFAGDFTTEEQELPGEEPAEYDGELMAILMESRREAVRFLESSSLPLAEKLAVLLLYGHDVQDWIDSGARAALTVQENLADAHNITAAAKADFSLFFRFFQQLEILTPQWAQRLKQAAPPKGWEEGLSPLVRYGIQRYWLQAVSDYDLVSRVKWIVSSCILVNALGGDPVATAQQFSKEIENDPDNMDAMLDGAYQAPALTDTHLLALLLKNS